MTQPEWKTPERPAAGERWLTRLTESILILALIGLVVLTLFLLSARVG